MVSDVPRDMDDPGAYTAACGWIGLPAQEQGGWGIMGISEQDRLRLRTNALRDRAETLLASLLNAQRAIDRSEPPPVCARIRSRDGMHRAITATKRFIDTLNSVLAADDSTALEEELSALLGDEDECSASEAQTPVSRPREEQRKPKPALRANRGRHASLRDKG